MKGLIAKLLCGFTLVAGVACSSPTDPGAPDRRRLEVENPTNTPVKSVTTWGAPSNEQLAP